MPATPLVLHWQIHASRGKLRAADFQFAEFCGIPVDSRTLSIEFTTGKALSMTIIQVEVPADSDMAFGDKPQQ